MRLDLGQVTMLNITVRLLSKQHNKASFILKDCVLKSRQQMRDPLRLIFSRICCEMCEVSLDAQLESRHRMNYLCFTDEPQRHETALPADLYERESEVSEAQPLRKFTMV